jgi:serine phosphatase RsbU (regulator of sigma subunit)
LGVLDVQVRSPADLVDPVLRDQCAHLASLVGHLVTTLGARGDRLDAVRRLRPRSPSAELVWQLLPPCTAESDTFTLSGRLEPADVVAGDTFDYALSETSVSLAVFDAMGHGLPAGLMAAAAVSAYRSARRNGQDLRAQAEAVDASISTVGTDGSFVTGFLGELDLTTGRLHYLSAGHPNPLLLRRGKMVRTLGGWPQGSLRTGPAGRPGPSS